MEGSPKVECSLKWGVVVVVEAWRMTFWVDVSTHILPTNPVSEHMSDVNETLEVSEFVIVNHFMIQDCLLRLPVVI